jgi:hypothetical protein
VRDLIPIWEVLKEMMFVVFQVSTSISYQTKFWIMLGLKNETTTMFMKPSRIFPIMISNSNGFKLLANDSVPYSSSFDVNRSRSEFCLLPCSHGVPGNINMDWLLAIICQVNYFY